MVEHASSSTLSTGQRSKKSVHGILKICTWVPPNWLVNVVISLLTPILLWMILFLLVREEGLPGGQIFALLVILFAGLGAGYLFQLIKLPPLFGMLMVGIFFRNVGDASRINFGADIKEDVSSPFRQVALVVILIRAGLGLDPALLRKLSGVVLRLTFGPCVVEGVVLAIVSHFILELPWAWGFLLGFAIAAVSPAVIVPALLSLRNRGYGVKKGIPTIVIAAASADDIVAISAFGVALGFTFSQNESLAMSIMRGPIEVVLGISYGLVWGLILGIFFGRSETDNKKATIFRLLFTFGGGCLSLFGFPYVGFTGSGALGCLSSAFIASIIWRKKGVLEDNDNLNWGFEKLWFVVQPLLFGLIGCEIDLYNLDKNSLVFGLLCLCIALTCRIVTSFFVVACAGLTVKERLFIALAWLPKATVQAAIGPVAYDLAKGLAPGPARVLAEQRGLQVLTICVLAILLTAPLGSIAIMIGGPRLLTKDIASEMLLTTGGDGDSKTSYTTGSTISSSQVAELMGPGLGPADRELHIKTADQDVVIKITSVASMPKASSNHDGGDVTKENNIPVGSRMKVA